MPFAPPLLRMCHLRIFARGCYLAAWLALGGGFNMIAPCAIAKSVPSTLTHEFAVQLPDFASAFAWSSNGQYLAVNQYNTGKVLFVDIANQKLSERFLMASNSYLSWSFDGKMIATNEMGQFNGVRVFSTETLEELGRKSRKEAECIFQHNSAFGFTSDNKNLWVSCEQRGFTDRYVTALKLSVPDLVLAESTEQLLKIPNLFGSSYSDFMMRDGTDLLHSSIISSMLAARDFRGQRLTRQLAAITRFSDKVQFGPVIELEADKNYQRFARRVIPWPEKERIVVFWGQETSAIVERPTVADKSNLPRLEIYDTSTGKRAIAFGAQANHPIAIHDVALARKSGLVIGALSALSPAKGGLVVWDAENGTELQRLNTKFPASWLNLAPDERSLVVIELNELHFYRLSNR